MVHFYTRITFIIGILCGILLALYVKRSVINRKFSLQNHTSNVRNLNLSYENWFRKQRLHKKSIDWDNLRYSNTSFYSESQFLYDKIKVMCIILVRNEKNLEAVKYTWGQGCNYIHPVTIQTQNKIMPRKQSKSKSSWVLICQALNAPNVIDYDWVLISKDTSFIITENLRYFLAPLNSKDQYYLGHAMKFWGVVYNSAEAGYVLSKGTIEEFQKHVGKNKCTEHSYWNREDFYVGKYLNSLNITPTNTIDDEGLSMFHVYNWYHAFNPGEGYFKNSAFPYKCCSKKSVSFQAIESDKMYTYNYIFYKLQIFTRGTRGNQRRLNSDIEDKQVWMKFLKERAIHDENISSDKYYKLWEDLVNDPHSFGQKMKKEDLFDY